MALLDRAADPCVLSQIVPKGGCLGKTAPYSVTSLKYIPALLYSAGEALSPKRRGLCSSFPPVVFPFPALGSPALVTLKMKGEV